MGHLLELVKLNLLEHGNDEAENFKNNTLFFSQKYQTINEMVKVVPLEKIKLGGFYFFTYFDDSKWISLAPVFVVDYKTFNGKVVLFCINFNFIPLKIRVALFDPYIKEEDFEKKEFFLKVKYDAMYKELRKYGFQYSLMEYNLAQLKSAHKINLDLLPRFLYSQHLKVKYDPKKLIDIWKKKIVEQDQRDKEMMSSSIDDFYNINTDMSGKYDLLKKHIDRLQKSAKKYGGK